MKTKLSLEGFSEISRADQQEINGGIAFLLPILSALIIAAGTEVIQDWDNFKNGLMGRPEEQ